MDDTISRQGAIDAINHICPVDTEYDCTLLDRTDVRYVLSDLPSTQSEFINEEIRFALKQLGAYFAIKIRDGKEGSVPIELFQRVEEIQKYFENMPSAQSEPDSEWRKKHYEAAYAQGFVDGCKSYERQFERKRGKWINDIYCSECGWVHEVESGFIGSVEDFNYCPNCGADMRKESDNG